MFYVHLMKNKSESRIILIKDWPYSETSWRTIPHPLWSADRWESSRHLDFQYPYSTGAGYVFNQPQGGQTYILDFQGQDEFKSALISTSTVAFVHISWSWVEKYSLLQSRNFFFFFYCFPLAQLLSSSSRLLQIFSFSLLSSIICVFLFLPKTLVPARGSLVCRMGLAEYQSPHCILFLPDSILFVWKTNQNILFFNLESH